MFMVLPREFLVMKSIKLIQIIALVLYNSLIIKQWLSRVVVWWSVHDDTSGAINTGPFYIVAWKIANGLELFCIIPLSVFIMYYMYTCMYVHVLQGGKFHTLSQGLREEVERLSRELHKWESYNIDQLVSATFNIVLVITNNLILIYTYMQQFGPCEGFNKEKENRMQLKQLKISLAMRQIFECLIVLSIKHLQKYAESTCCTSDAGHFLQQFM